MLGKDAALGVVDPRALIAPMPTPIIEQTPRARATNARNATEPKCFAASPVSRAGRRGRRRAGTETSSRLSCLGQSSRGSTSKHLVNGPSLG